MKALFIRESPNPIVHRSSTWESAAELPGYALTRETMVEFFVTEKRNPNAIDADWPGDFVYFPHQPGSAQAHAAKEGALPAPTRAVPRR